MAHVSTYDMAEHARWSKVLSNDWGAYVWKDIFIESIVFIAWFAVLYITLVVLFNMRRIAANGDSPGQQLVVMTFLTLVIGQIAHVPLVSGLSGYFMYELLGAETYSSFVSVFGNYMTILGLLFGS